MARMPIEPRLPSPRAALTALTGINLFNYLDRYVLGAVLPAVTAALALSDTQAGSLPTVFILTFAVISPVAGMLGDRQPRFRLAAIGVLVWSLATCASGLAQTFAALALARAVTGVGEASYTVVTPSLLSDFYPPSKRSSALARFYAAIPIGSAAGFLLGGVVNAHWGWRAAFFVAGAPGALLAIVLLAFRDPPRGAHDQDQGVPLSTAAALRALGERKSYWFNTAAQTLYTFTMGGLAIWMPTYFVRIHHLPLAAADLGFGGILVVAGFIGTLAGGRVGERLAARRSDGHFLVSAISLMGSLPFTLVALLHPSPAIFWPAMFVSLTLLFVNSGPLNAAMANVLPPELRARGFSICSVSIHLLGDAPSPFIIGAVSSRVGLEQPVLAIALLPVLAGIVLMAGRAALRRDLEAGAAEA
jgi:predicted MFS family arabinose efflux permease